MRKIGMFIVVFSILLTACTNLQVNSTLSQTNQSTSASTNQSTSSETDDIVADNIRSFKVIPSIEPTNKEVTKTDEEIIQERMKKLERKGELDLNHIKVVGVKGSLLKTILTYLEAVKEKDDKKRLSTIYAPDLFSDSLNNIEPYVFAVTRLKPDNTRVKKVTEWYGLDKLADEVIIVNIEYQVLNNLFEKILTNADYIYIRVNGQWKLYETQ
ncbi:hypothetical protein [Paenibacillus sp. LHD-38]|uniref:hypothetical protein n=1 Tax=Paenibacillus sp. LHD-38 TaxID=3072143 RepID=UPI00280F7EED|nr:hypothetical protein [Paenibacillus sp. LHD-38]MDQ8733862.1 hypothetical protein [Paenibacillus sp. LHD-38]